MRDLRTLAGHYFSATPKPESFSLSFHDPRRLTVGPMPDLGSHRFQKVSSTRRTPVDVAAARRSYAPECGGSRFAAAAPARFFRSSFSACDHVAYRLIQPGARAGGSAWRASHGHRPTAEARPCCRIRAAPEGLHQLHAPVRAVLARRNPAFVQMSAGAVRPEIADLWARRRDPRRT
jgi:hypothetical protein